MLQQQPRLRRGSEAPGRRRNGSLVKVVSQSILLSWFVSAGILLFHQDLEQSGLVMLMLIAAAMLTTSSARFVFYGLFWARCERGWRIGVHAELCTTVLNASLEGITAARGVWHVAIINSTAFDLSTIFACEGGQFNVSWFGVVEVSSTIKIGNGTSVRIYGENDATSAAVTASTTGSGTSLASTSPSTSRNRSTIAANNNSSGSSSSSTVDLEFELDRRSSDLNLPHELRSAAVRSNGSASFGPYFFVDGGELHLERVAIRSGISTNFTVNSIGVGGGINATYSIVSVSSCVFEDNFAENLGGGIHPTYSTLTVKNSVFRGNRAGYRSFPDDDTEDGNGGAIACEYTRISINGSLFNDNYARNKGGGVHMGNGQVSVVDSLFFNNTAGSSNVDDAEPHGEGAAFSFTVCTQSFDGLSACGVNDTAFIYNAAGKKGGGIAIGSGSGPSYIEFHRCLIHNSTTGWPFKDDPQGEGGGFSMSENTTLVLEDCVVTDNYCGKKGSAITISTGDSWRQPGGSVIMRNSTFTGNMAEGGSAGAVYVGEFSTARFEGDDNNFTGNFCGTEGGVLAASTDTNITVEGGWFEGNEADEDGGVFWVKGRLNISGGIFFRNDASEGGVVFASEESFVTVYGGHFDENEASDGGVIYVNDGATLIVQGGIFTENTGENGGGVIWTKDEGDVEITGGSFTRNTAVLGGFLYMEGGKVVCAGASVVGNKGVDGGAIYAAEEAVLDWACDLVENEALVGPAIYAREEANVTIHDAYISDNIIARGSVVFIVSSFVHTFNVNFIDTTESADLSAVQSDDDSTFVAEETAFIGFQGETVVFSEGILYLDDCDFRESSASMLVHSKRVSTTVIRNAALGDQNFVQETSDTSDTIGHVTLIDVDLNCSESGWPCSPGSICLEGDLGVYCQCYERYSTSKERCLEGDPLDLNLSEKASPTITYYPSLLEGEIVVSLGGDVASSNSTPTMTMMETTSSQSSDSVIWIVSATHHEFISWTFVPSIGLLHSGTTITVRAVSLPDAHFDGNTTVTFSTKGIGVPDESASALSSGSADAIAVVENDDDLDVGVLQNMTFTFYHCREGRFWNLTSTNSDPDSASCNVCSESAEGNTEGLACNYPGVSTRNLPVVSGFWRANLGSVIILECFNEDACIGGSNVESVDDYCSAGYENVYCGVCSSGYGRGSSNTCHECTSAFKGAMYSVICVAALITIFAIVLLGVYLVGGRTAVSQTMLSTKSSVRMLHRRGSELFLRSEDRTHLGNDLCASSGGEGSKDKKKSPPCSSTMNESHDKSQGPSAWDAAVVSTDEQSAADGDKGSCRGRVATTTDVSGEVASRQENDEGAYEHGGGANSRPRDGKGQEEEPTEKEKSAAIVIGEVLGSLPLSKLKIVIVVWQISSAFADITEVPFPEVYERFLSVIGICSFDLSWIMSAACITSDLDFYAELIIVMIGPMVLFGLLWVTFYLGARPARPTPRDFSSSIGGRSSGVTTPSTIAGTNIRPDHKWWWDTSLAQAEKATVQGEGVRTYASLTGSSGRFALVEKNGEDSKDRCRSCVGTISMSDESATFSSAAMAVAETTTGSREKHAFSKLGTTGSATVAIEAGAGLSESIPQIEKAEEGAQDTASFGLESQELLTKRWSIRRIWKDGPGDDAESEQNHLWWLFARHTTMGLIILYLIYSTVSTVIFQTFQCQTVEDLGTSFLRADLRIECDTPKHKAYSIYAWVMIFIYPLGIPTVFWFFLAKYKKRIDPPIDEDVEDQGNADHLMQEKEKIRKNDPTIAPTSFLWSAYYPNRYNFEVYECIRRLMLTAVLVFLADDTVGQVAYSCLFAFISLLGFELLRPHTDRLDRMLYRTGCLVIFFTNFLALVIKVGVAEQNSKKAAVYSVGLIIVNIFFVLSIWWNTWATIKAIFSRRHVQGVVLGVDMIEEDNMERVVATLKEKRNNRLQKAKEDVKIEDLETTHASKEDHSKEEEPIDINSSSALGYLERQGSRGRYRGASSAWAITPLEPSAAAPIANSVFDSGPRSRGFPYASTKI